jgi:hypothetical protein
MKKSTVTLPSKKVAGAAKIKVTRLTRQSTKRPSAQFAPTTTSAKWTQQYSDPIPGFVQTKSKS